MCNDTLYEYFTQNTTLYELMCVGGELLRVPFSFLPIDIVFDGIGVYLPNKFMGRMYFTENDIGVTLFKTMNGGI